MSGRKILLGISGSIAAYKAPELVRLLRARGASVKCLLTVNGARFVTPLTLQTVSANKVYQDMFDSSDWEMDHISLSDWADMIIIAPASADAIARLACGRAQDLLSSVVLAFDKKVLICPAMNDGMWKNPATKRNIALLKEYGMYFAGPDKVELACGVIGSGRLTDLNNILRTADTILSK